MAQAGGEQEQAGLSTTSSPGACSDPRPQIQRPHQKARQCQGSQGTGSYHRHRLPDPSPRLASPTHLQSDHAKASLTPRSPQNKFLVQSGWPIQCQLLRKWGSPSHQPHRSPRGRKPSPNPSQYCPAKRADGAHGQPGLQLVFLRTCLRPQVALGPPQGIWPWREQRCTHTGAVSLRRSLAAWHMHPGTLHPAPRVPRSCVVHVCLCWGWAACRSWRVCRWKPCLLWESLFPQTSPKRWEQGSSFAPTQHPGVEFSPSLLSPLLTLQVPGKCPRQN